MKKFLLTLLTAIISMAVNAQQWEIDYGDSFSYTSLYQGIINADGDAIVMGVWGEDKNHYRPMTMRVDMEGNYDIHAFEDEQFNMLRPSDILQLENGNYFMVGVKDNTLIAIVFDSDFNVIHVKAYVKPENALSIWEGRMLDDDGTVIFCGYYSCQSATGQSRKPYFYRFDENADTISCRFVTAELPHPEASIKEFNCFQLLKNPKSEGVIVLCSGLNNMCSLLMYDDDFNYVDGFNLQPAFRQYFENAYSDHWLSDDKLLIMGYMWPYEELTEWNIGLAEVCLDGTFGRCERVYYKQDTAVKAPPKCMGYVNDTTIYGLTYNFKSVFSGPYYAGVFLFDKDMEVLGKREFYEPEYENHVPSPGFIIPLPDGGCLFNAEVSTLFLGDYTYGKLIKMRREDFDPIPCSVKEVPQEVIKVLAYPNPAKDELNIDISGLPEHNEHRIQITDALGHICLDRIIRSEGNVLTVGVSGLKAGVYVYSIYNAEKEIARNKFIKE